MALWTVCCGFARRRAAFGAVVARHRRRADGVAFADQRAAHVREAAQQAARLVIGVGLATQLPVMLVTTAAVLLLCAAPVPPPHQTGATMGTNPARDRERSDSTQRSPACVGRRASFGTYRPWLRRLRHRVCPTYRNPIPRHDPRRVLAQRTVLSNERPDAVLQTMLYDLAAQLLSLDGLRKEIAKIGSERPALVSRLCPSGCRSVGCLDLATTAQ